MGQCFTEPIQPQRNSSRVLGWTGSDLVLRWALWQPDNDNNYHLLPHDSQGNLLMYTRAASNTSGPAEIAEKILWKECNKTDGLQQSDTDDTTSGRCGRLIMSAVPGAVANIIQRPQLLPQRPIHKSLINSLSLPQTTAIQSWINTIETTCKQELNLLQKSSVQNFWISTHLLPHSAFFQAQP